MHKPSPLGLPDESSSSVSALVSSCKGLATFKSSLYFRTFVHTGHTQRFGKSGGSVLPDTFVVNQTLVLRINICGKNRHLRQAAKRRLQF